MSDCDCTARCDSPRIGTFRRAGIRLYCFLYLLRVTAVPEFWRVSCVVGKVRTMLVTSLVGNAAGSGKTGRVGLADTRRRT